MQMGLFSKSEKSKGLFLQFPDGSVVNSQSDVDRLMSDFTFTPSTMNDWRLNAPDTQALVDASAKLYLAGLNEEPIFAFGPVKLSNFPKSHNEYIADGVLTPNYLIVYYQKNILKPDILILPLLNLSGLNSLGTWSAEFNFKNGIHIDKSGTYEMAETFIGLSERLGKDGQANRRSVTFMKSLGNTLNEVHMP
jgi:hypothetical protein